MDCPECANDAAVEQEREITAKIDNGELVKAWEERAAQARGVRVVSILGAKTDLGRVRENNEDKFEFFQPDDEDVLARKGSFYAVADGMGGHAAGQIASEIALKTVIGAYYADPSPVVEDSLRSAVQQANAIIFETARAISERSGMGTTLTALVVRGEEVFIAQVGDSRAYRVRGGSIVQMTDDHSWVNEQVKRGAISADEAEHSPFRNVITRSLGNAPGVQPDIISDDLRVGDAYVLCSDGLSGEVTADDIRDAVKNSSPSQAAWDLVELALERGGRDNVTVLVLAITDIIKGEKNRRKGLGALLGRG